MNNFAVKIAATSGRQSESMEPVDTAKNKLLQRGKLNRGALMMGKLIVFRLNLAVNIS